MNRLFGVDIRKSCKHRRNGERGSVALEYGLKLAILTVVALPAISALRSDVNSTFEIAAAAAAYTGGSATTIIPGDNPDPHAVTAPENTARIKFK
ncbi:MAG: hypothetical protein KDD66_11105 [Bdellovibrionales bacterium]|nr:hypothetical protein [Bdellovibrionales bacterium]